MTSTRTDGRADATAAGEAAGERGARRRHPTAHPWRTDHDALAVRLAAHLETQGWSGPDAHAEAEDARTAATRR